MSWIDGQVAMITGGGSGLGRSLVQRFLEENASVGVLELSPAKAADLRREFGGDVVVVEGDAAALADNRKAVAQTVERFGKLDTFIANAAIWDHNASLVEIADDKLNAAFDELFHINVKAYLAGAKAAVPELAKTCGSIIFTGSNACFYPGGGGPLYTASKHAVLGLMRQLAYELAPDIRVNGVAPCGMASDLRGPSSLGLDTRTLTDTVSMESIARGLPIQFVPNAEDFTGSYVLLASKHNSRTITGTMLHADGGLVARGLRKPIANFQPEPATLHGG
jgi:2,3-dihydroxy-2,3-dihydrophenylpropionate dehydrogenase